MRVKTQKAWKKDIFPYRINRNSDPFCSINIKEGYEVLQRLQLAYGAEHVC